MNRELCDEKMKNHEHQLEDHEKRINKLEDTYATLQKMNYRLDKMENSMLKIDKKIDAFSKAPIEEKSKKWDKLVDYLFYFVLALLLGYIALKLGLAK